MIFTAPHTTQKEQQQKSKRKYKKHHPPHQTRRQQPNKTTQNKTAQHKIQTNAVQKQTFMKAPEESTNRFKTTSVRPWLPRPVALVDSGGQRRVLLLGDSAKQNNSNKHKCAKLNVPNRNKQQNKNNT